MRQPWQSLRLSRLLLGSSALLLASCLAAAADEAGSRAHAAAQGPSKFDFIVFASMADSPHLLAMAGYRPVSTACAASSTVTRSDPAAGTHLPRCRL
jgi:hypothetical protein